MLEMRLPKRRLLVTVLLGVGVAVAFAAMSLAAEPTIEGTNSTATWTPTSAEVSQGGSVTFKNSSASVPHGVHWVSVPETPSCGSGVPIDEGKTNWSGSCTFTNAGTYSFRCFVHPGMTGTVTVTGPAAPTVSTGEGTPTSDTEATLHGTVNPNELETKYFFKYGTTTSYGKETSKTTLPVGTSPVPASAEVTELAPGMTYHFRLFAENSLGTVSGADHTFMTSGPPLATTGTATGVGATEATLQGTVNPDGHPTTYFFKYGTTTAYGQETNSVQLSASDHNQHAVSAALTNLSPETTYHFQLVAQNTSSGGPVLGSDRTLTTSSAPPPPPAEEPPPPPAGEPPPPPPAEETPPLGSAVTVGAAGHRAPVRVSVLVLASGVGGRLEVDLLEKGGGAKHAIAGRIVRREVPFGKVSVAVPLNARAKRALRRRHHLSLEVKIVFTPPSGASLVITRSVILRG